MVPHAILSVVSPIIHTIKPQAQDVCLITLALKQTQEKSATQVCCLLHVKPTMRLVYKVLVRVKTMYHR